MAKRELWREQKRMSKKLAGEAPSLEVISIHINFFDCHPYSL